MAHCDEYSELISASLDGALSPAETEKLNAHLAQCPDCRALLEELSALHAALSDLPPVEVPSGLTERIMAAVAAEQVLPFAPPEQKKPSGAGSPGSAGPPATWPPPRKQPRPPRWPM